MSLARATDLRPEDLAGRTWAGYVRESTKGQADRYGPDIQRTEQTRFAERHGLVTTGLEYLDLVSGKDTLRRSDFTRMVGDAEAGAFDVLLVYDTSRFARNIEDAYAYRRRIAAAGCHGRVLRRQPHRGQRRHLRARGPQDGRRRRLHPQALAQRRAAATSRSGASSTTRVGTRRSGSPGPATASCCSPSKARTSSASGGRSRSMPWAPGATSTLADELGLTEAGIAEILVNPLYAGRVIRHKGRPDQEERPARFAAPVDPALFERVQAIREERRTRHPGRTVLRRPYPARPAHALRPLRQHVPRRQWQRLPAHPPRPPSRLRALGDLSRRALRGPGRGAVRWRDARGGGCPSGAGSRCGRPRRGPSSPIRPDCRRPGSTCSVALNDGTITLEMFSREWRRLERPAIRLARPDPTSCAWPGHGTLSLSSGPCGGTLPCPTDSERKPSARSSSASTWTARRSSPPIHSRTRTRGCSASWQSVRNGCARNE